MSRFLSFVVWNLEDAKIGKLRGISLRLSWLGGVEEGEGGSQARSKRLQDDQTKYVAISELEGMRFYVVVFLLYTSTRLSHVTHFLTRQ